MILIVDDHELFCTSLAIALRYSGFDARPTPVAHLAVALDEQLPATGLVVLDLDLGRDADGRYVHGAELVEGLVERGWKVLVVSGSLDRPGIAAAIAAGAIGSVPKTRSFDVLLGTVLTAARCELVLTADERRDWTELHRYYLAQERGTARRLARLSRREREVLELLAQGMRAATIAEHFVVSMPTVRTQIRSILAKLEVGSQLEAAALLRQVPDLHGRRPLSDHPSWR